MLVILLYLRVMEAYGIHLKCWKGRLRDKFKHLEIFQRNPSVIIRCARTSLYYKLIFPTLQELFIFLLCIYITQNWKFYEVLLPKRNYYLKSSEYQSTYNHCPIRFIHVSLSGHVLLLSKYRVLMH